MNELEGRDRRAIFRMTPTCAICPLPMHAIRASARHAMAIHATAELLEKQRIESMFVGAVARSAWLGEEVASGPVDLVALMNAPQKNQVAMMASHRGFRVEKEEIEQAEELDLIPLNFIHAEGEVRVHVLLASNALYGRMVAAALPSTLDQRPVRVPSAEDLALLALVAEDAATVSRLSDLPGFDRTAFRDRVVSIGLRGGWGEVPEV
jgi:hypothetical protein